ncbi:MAG TPA: YidB family protein, partial [Deltaproteobacteria bacterium]|nr:YidB family protein [Deltaproteobacteria bacterium]
GGLSGLVQSLREKGLGDVVNSWISTGNNLPVSGEQIRQFLGGEQIQQLAAKVGTSKDDASNMLALLLPRIIDKLTPDGRLPEGGVLEQGLDVLKKKLLG